MRKIFTIALREFKAIVGTKAFVISLAMMPVLMFGSMFAIEFLRESGSVEEKTIAVIDLDGSMYPALDVAAKMHNAMMDAKIARETVKADGETDTESDADEPDESLSFSKGFKYYLEKVDVESFDDELRLDLSRRVKDKDLSAFVEIPSEVDQVDAEGKLKSIVYYSEDSGISETKNWVAQVLNMRIKSKRLERAGIDAVLVEQASMPIDVRGVGLVQRTANGTASVPDEKNEMAAIFLPFGIMMMMFMVILMSSQPMLESVLEEKSNRIAEVLLGSENPTQIMAGKLLGTVAGSLLIFAIYTGGALYLSSEQGLLQDVPLYILPWFVVYQVLGVMFFASIFMAVAAAVSQLKEAQSALIPVWMMLMCPLFVWLLIVQQPNSGIATAISFFPPATPTTMMLRMATGATIPLWQPIVGLVLLLVATAFCVFVAGRVFRIGILWQGKTPKITEILRWALAG